MHTFKSLLDQIEQIARFESLVHLPEKFGDVWVARATVEGHGVDSQGETYLEAMQNVLKTLLLK